MTYPYNSFKYIKYLKSRALISLQSGDGYIGMIIFWHVLHLHWISLSLYMYTYLSFFSTNSPPNPPYSNCSVHYSVFTIMFCINIFL